VFRSWYWRGRYWRALFFGPSTEIHPARRTGKVVVRRPAWPVRVTVQGVEGRGYAGVPQVLVGAGVLLEGAAVACSLGSIDCTAIQNPTEEELAVLLLLPQVGG
jgi:hypothetical protein